MATSYSFSGNGVVGTVSIASASVDVTGATFSLPKVTISVTQNTNNYYIYGYAKWADVSASATYSKAGTGTATLAAQSQSTSGWFSSLNPSIVAIVESLQITITAYTNSSMSTSVKGWSPYPHPVTFTIRLNTPPTFVLSVGDVGTVPSGWGYTAGLSKLKLIVSNVSLKYGATLNGYKLKVGSSTSTNATYTSGTLSAGSVAYSAQVIDSRYLTGTKSGTISVAAYTSPTISNLTAVRCDSSGTQDDEGEYAQVEFDWTASNTYTNTATATLSYVSGDGTESGNVPISSGGTGLSGHVSVLVPNMDTGQRYTFTAQVADKAKTVRSSVLLSSTAFIMDFREYGTGIGIGTSAPQEGLSIAMDTSFFQGVELKNAQPEIEFTTPGTNYTSYIRAYDTNTAGAGHNTVIQSGGNMFLGGGESPNALYQISANASASDVPALTSEAPALSSDSWVYLFSNCGTVANRQRIAFGGSDGILEIPGNLRLVNKTELGTYYPNARANTDLGYVYGQHIRLRSREPDLDNNATSRTAQVSNVPLDVTDQDNNTFMRLTARQTTDGTVRGMLEVAGTHTGSTVWNAICVDVRKDGSQHYGVNNATNFRSDLGINNAANLTTGTLPQDRLPTVSIANGGTGATTAAAARTNLGITRANLAEKMHAVTIFSGLSVAKGGTLGTSTDVFDYQFFMITSASTGYMLGYRTGSTSSAGSIRAIGGFDDGSTSYAYVCQLAVSTAGKVTNTCCSRHNLATQAGAALNITGLYGLR